MLYALIAVYCYVHLDRGSFVLHLALLIHILLYFVSRLCSVHLVRSISVWFILPLCRLSPVKCFNIWLPWARLSCVDTYFRPFGD